MAQADSANTTRRDLLRFAAAAVPAAIVGTAAAASAPVEKSDAELLSIFARRGACGSAGRFVAYYQR